MSTGSRISFAADQTGEVRADRLDLVECVHEARHVAAAVLDADDARAVVDEAFDHFEADLVGKLGDVVEDDVDGRFRGEFAEVMLDALLADLEIIRAPFDQTD
jgi:hypothetical protein